MSGSTYGTLYKVTTWGESHGKGVGVIIDGCPAGLPLKERDIQLDLNKRRPGQSIYCTPRNEADRVTILSGVFEGKTTGTPIHLMVKNKDHRSRDYTDILSIYRPGHADYAYDQKYGFRDYRGGGRSSGRETIGRVAAGAIAKKILASIGVQFLTYTKSIAHIEADYANFDPDAIYNNPFRFPDPTRIEEIESYVKGLIKEGNSAGGIIESRIYGVQPGIGEPVFNKLDGLLAHGIMSIGAIKGFEIGAGFQAAKMTGYENNDFYQKNDQAPPEKASNHAGGMTGGISDGSPIVFRAAMKATPSIHLEQEGLTTEGKVKDLVIGGRHDPVIVPRAVIVVEAMAAITLLDLYFQQMPKQLDFIKKAFS